MLKRVLSATFVVKSWEKIGRHGLSKETASVSISISQNASVFSFFGLLVALFTRSLLLSEVAWHVPSFWVQCRLFPYFLLVGKRIVLFTFLASICMHYIHHSTRGHNILWVVLPIALFRTLFL